MAKLNLFISSPRLLLRPLEERDLPTTLEWRNAQRQCFLDSSHITEKAHRAWFESYLTKDDDVVLVAEGDDGKIVAQAAVYGISGWSAEFGRMIVDPARERQGIGREVLELVIDVCRRAGIFQLQLEVFESNTQAVKLYTKCGFAVKNSAMRTLRDGRVKAVYAMERRDWEIWTDRAEAIKIEGFWADTPAETHHRYTLARAVTPYLERCRTVLEVGCGTGRTLEALAEVVTPWDIHWTGCDISQSMVMMARGRLPRFEFLIEDAFALSFDDGSFDAVVSFEVLSHLPDHVQPLREMVRVCRRVAVFSVWAEPPPAWPNPKAIHRVIQDNEILKVVPAAKKIQQINKSVLWVYEKPQ